MPMSRYHKLSYRVFGGLARRLVKPRGPLHRALQRAHIDQRPEVYLSFTFMHTALATFATAVAVLLFMLLTQKLGSTFGAALLLVLAPVPLVLGGAMFLLTRYMPDMIAENRARDIDMKLPSAINYISTMAGAGFTVETIFESLADQPIYGEVSNEAAWIKRDVRMLGMDIVSALGEAMDRSPSMKLQDFLQGTVTTVTSGGQLRDYFLAKSEQYMLENRQDQRKFLESLGLLAESYVTIVVAAPVFLIILLSVMLMFGGSGRSLLVSGYALILIFLPIAQYTFGAMLKFFMPET